MRDFWPDSPIQSLRRQQHTRPTQGEYGYEPAPVIRDNTAEPGMGFTSADYSAAVRENIAFNMCRDIEARKRK